MLVVDALRMDAPRIHVGASGILIQQNRVLMGKRNADDSALPGLWCTPGGGLEIGETLMSCVAREFSEEVGIFVNVVHPVVFIGERLPPESASGNHTILHFYKVVQTCAQPPQALDGFSEVKFWHWNEIWQSEELITPLTYAALRSCFRELWR